MNATDYKVCIRMLNQTARMAEHVHMYPRVIFVCVTCVSDTLSSMLNTEFVAGLYRI